MFRYTVIKSAQFNVFISNSRGPYIPCLNIFMFESVHFQMNVLSVSKKMAANTVCLTISAQVLSCTVSMTMCSKDFIVALKWSEHDNHYCCPPDILIALQSSHSQTQPSHTHSLSSLFKKLSLMFQIPTLTSISLNYFLIYIFFREG